MDALTRGLLTDGHEVKLLSIATEKHPWRAADLDAEYIQQTGIETVHLDTRVNRVDAFANLLTGDSYNISRFHAPEFEQLLVHVLRRQVFDLVIFESLFTAPYLPLVRQYCDGPLVLRAHNVEHRIWELMAAETEAFTKRMYLQHLAERLKAYEVNALHDFDAIAAISAKDCEDFKALGCTCPVFTLPFGLDDSELPPAAPGPIDHVFHIGAMDWEPNVQGVQWFLDQVWPTVLRELPEAQLKLAGRKFNDQLDVQRTNTTVLGEVPDAWDVLCDSGIMVILCAPEVACASKRLKPWRLDVPWSPPPWGWRAFTVSTVRTFSSQTTPIRLPSASSTCTTTPGKHRKSAKQHALLSKPNFPIKP